MFLRRNVIVLKQGFGDFAKLSIFKAFRGEKLLINLQALFFGLSIK
jgi:hypothetical protein